MTEVVKERELLDSNPHLLINYLESIWTIMEMPK